MASAVLREYAPEAAPVVTVKGPAISLPSTLVTGSSSPAMITLVSVKEYWISFAVPSAST